MKKRLIKIIQHNKILRNTMPRILRYFNPRYSFCNKCGLPWNWCNTKTVMTSEHCGTFATCDYCWKHSTLAELKQYYTICYEMQCRTGGDMEHTLKYLLRCVEIDYRNQKKAVMWVSKN